MGKVFVDLKMSGCRCVFMKMLQSECSFASFSFKYYYHRIKKKAKKKIVLLLFIFVFFFYIIQYNIFFENKKIDVADNSCNSFQFCVYNFMVPNERILIKRKSCDVMKYIECG